MTRALNWKTLRLYKLNRSNPYVFQNSPLKLPPDQRLWRIDENIFSEGSSVATSRKSSVQSLEDNLPNWLTDEVYQENQPRTQGARPILRTEL